ncbi:hypothetical protein [Brevundimonas sp.]|jgi:hypothetical protein|uniref:hypothetical protein n=1 Tax=Brevundimonas sp. TaxID=1871086 RepID=UPI002E113FA1|nr:hypothetical protein [Brevundimonas sp.]
MLALALTLMLALPVQDADPGTRTEPQDPPTGAAQPAQPPGSGSTASGTTEGSAVATLQGCAMEDGRWVCRYQMPEIRVVEEAPTRLSVVPAAGGSGSPSDVGVLTDADRALVARCADAGWLSLCLPGDRRRARELREASTAYETVRREVTASLAQGRCDLAVTSALEAGHLNLAREARTFCGE